MILFTFRYADDHRLCCNFDTLKKCTVLSEQPPLFNCGSLMQNMFLRVSMWILGISALIGNLIAVAWRLKEKTRNSKTMVQSFMVGNLAVSDFLMGLYMIVIASADLYYGDDYFIYSDAWRNGAMCRIAGFICLLSSEASVFFLTLISFDRFMGAVFPFSQSRFTIRSVKATSFVLWLISLLISAIPIIVAGPDSDFYDLSDVCIGLPLITRPSSYELEASKIGGQATVNLPVAKESKPAWYFSIAIFLGLNLCCFLSIFVFYVAVFVKLRKSSQKLNRGQRRARNSERKLAIKMAVIVGTDFLCWMPVILMGVLSQTGLVVIPLEAYIWCVVFILPINSALNPYLYTVASVLASRKQRGQVDTSTNSTNDNGNNTQETNN